MTAKWTKIAGLLLTIVWMACSSSAQLPSNTTSRVTAAEEKSLRKLLQPSGRGAGRGFNLYSREDERQMGEDAALAIEENAKLLQDAALTDYLAKLGRKLAEQSEAREMEFRFKVIESDEVNATALPNGTVYVNTGLVIAAESEAELAAVLAHEIAHVAARHASRAATRRGLWGAASLGMAIFGGGIGVAAQPALGITSGGFVMKFNRDAEREADVLGMKYVYAAGYDPEAFLRFLVRMKVASKKKPGAIERMNATHPEIDERVRRGERALELAMPRRDEAIDDTSEFIEARQRVLEATHPEMIEGRPVLKLAHKVPESDVQLTPAPEAK